MITIKKKLLKILSLIGIIYPIPTILTSGQYYSQLGQDKYINETIFNGQTNLTFVEVGAYDGIKGSNSYFFEKKLSWNGICIEPLPKRFEQLKKNRSCICKNVAIGESEGTASFFIIGNHNVLSGRAVTWELEHEERRLREGHTKQTIQVPLHRLQSILDEHHILHIDYLSIDVEGGELGVLKSIDWEKTHIILLTVENNYNKQHTRDFLTEKGYTLIKKLSIDDVWLKNSELHRLGN